jgi:heme-degrading monooxygenase HmoA
MHARIGRITFSPDKATDVESHVRDTIVPRYEDADGYKGFTLLLDRSGGQGVGISFWESEDAMRATDDIGNEARAGAAEAGGGADQGRDHYEVALDTMA